MVDGINNIASQIFAKLDSQDSKGTDNKIEASIWNKFVSDKGGKEISNYISKESAVKSIVRYLTNMSQKLSCTVEELANQWLGKSEANPSEISGEKSKLNSKSVDIPAIVVEDKKLTAEENQEFQECVTQSLGLISDVANGKYKYEIETDNSDKGFTEKTIKLKDGRKIHVALSNEANGKHKIGYIEVKIGGTNYNGNQNTVYFNPLNSASENEYVSYDTKDGVFYPHKSTVALKEGSTQVSDLCKIIAEILKDEDIEL